jgi:hypothetical protein
MRQETAFLKANRRHRGRCQLMLYMGRRVVAFDFLGFGGSDAARTA